MDLSKLRRGELVAAVGGIVLLFVLLFLDWYKVGGIPGAIGGFGAWDHQGFTGTIANLVILAAGVAAVGLAIVTATSRTVALPVAGSALTAGLGIGAVVMVLLRMLFQPGPGELIDLEFAIWVALAGAIAVAVGGWQSMQEEGTTFEQAKDQLEERFGSRPGDGGPAEGPPPAA
jgi:hypothetical protein